MRRTTIAAALLAALGASAQAPSKAPAPAQPAAPAASPMTESLAMRAAARLQAGDVRGALADVEMAIARDSRNAGAYALRGTIRMATGDREGALLDLSRAIELTPPGTKGIEVVYVNRANVYWLQGNPRAATADVDTALKLNPQLALGYNMRGRLKSDAGDLDGARGDFDRAIQLEPKMMPAYVARAAVNMQAGRLQESISDYKTLMWSLPNDADVIASHGILRGMLGETGPGVDDLVKARMLSARSVSDEPRGAQGSPAQRLDDYISMNPNEARAVLMRAALSFINDERDRGLKELDRAVRLDPALKADADAIRKRAGP